MKNKLIKRRNQIENSLRIGIDTGGTFTDFIAIFTDGRVDHRLSFKLPSTPRAPEEAIISGLRRIFDEFIKSSHDEKMPFEIVHGTTVATNALLERKGARTALVTTAGFEDIIEIGRQARPDLYNFLVTRPDPLVPGYLRFGLRERISPDSGVIEPLNGAELDKLVARLKRAKIESIAVSLLFSFADPSHEIAVAEALVALGVPVSVSHQILPEYREYERTSTIVINAYLAPRVSVYLQYLGEMSRIMSRQFGRSGSLRIMQSSGGSISGEIAAREPVRTILSGPAGGVIAATRVAELAGVGDIITFDMGGTSTDVSLCRGGVRTTNEAKIAGLPVSIPVIDIHTVGAGGGSIAFVDAGGALRVGPQSAGADPGPACYGKGTRPTVTDANLVLGRFAGSGLLNGEMQLDLNRAARVIDDLAEELSRASSQPVTREEAALGVIRVANANMERALRIVSVERGYDPRHFTLLTFGGAGGLHAAALAGALRIPRVLIPADPGAFSALGTLLADVIKDYSRTVMITIDSQRDVGRRVAQEFSRLGKRAARELGSEGFSSSKIRLIRSLAMRYRGQSFELEIVAGSDLRDCVEDFHRAHRERYGHADPGRVVEIVSVRLRGIGMTEKPELERASRLKRFKVPRDRSAFAWIGEKRRRVSIYDRASLRPGASIVPPAIITEYGSTTLVPPGWRSSMDRYFNLVLEREERSRNKPK